MKKMIFKNDIKYLNILLALFISGNIFAQVTLEFTSGARNLLGSSSTLTIPGKKNTDNPTNNTAPNIQ
ncbi:MULTISPECIES: hypothetical protein [unclassified Chryseobacterium]|uniref:hypothetical protein n=1 Tax=unclassified Chryseobacterium TaxID=2593645 RepID=UPI003017EF7E